MILVDTGPLVALHDADDADHETCVKVLKQSPVEPLLTTWICFTEAMYLLGNAGGHRHQSALCRLYSTERLILHDLTRTEATRMEALMAKYHDTPMDLADASLIVAAESLGFHRIFTLDSDFYVYRLADGSALEVIP